MAAFAQSNEIAQFIGNDIVSILVRNVIKLSKRCDVVNLQIETADFLATVLASAKDHLPLWYLGIQGECCVFGRRIAQHDQGNSGSS